MLETYKIKFARAIEDKDFVNSISEYISELGICTEYVCRYCKDHACKMTKDFMTLMNVLLIRRRDWEIGLFYPDQPGILHVMEEIVIFS